MATIGNTKKNKMEAAKSRRLARGAKKMAAKAKRSSEPKKRWF